MDPGTSNEFAGTVGTFYHDQLFYSVYTLSENFEDVTVTLTNVESGETWQLIVAPDGYFERDIRGDDDIGDYTCSDGFEYG